ncbi:adenine phosphoribosyltransferase 1-like isoform X3 [Carex littledalei]|uniref:adenine phosphoribosyltransferase n=1 Tax=Carex littledalei TaxID=544730 RepID=A0A833RE53_9POAL|nr:adenine phosphoribosyltransferase 1-like isoform X3 [Carex littledalei]
MLLFKSLNCSSSLLQSPVLSSRLFPSVVVRTPRTLSVRRIRTNRSISMASTDDSRLKRIASSIRVIPDFPKPEGVMFQDITTLLLDPQAFKDTIDLFVERYKGKGITVVAGIEARGFIFGPPIALAIGAKFVPMRKPKKLPGEVISEEYSLEYGTDKIEIHVDAVQPGDRALVIDDLVATGGTLSAAIRLLERVGAEVVESACVIELPELKEVRLGYRSEDVQSLVLVDVTPLSLGIETKGDVLTVLIPRNTPIPIKKEGIFTTCSDFQSTIPIRVYEGERARSEDNNLLGQFTLDGILLAPQGVPKINVCFNIDADGILNVTAEDTSTGEKRHMTLMNVDRLTNKEIERMMEEAERFKAEDEEHRKKVRARNKLESFAYALKNAVEERKVVKSMPHVYRESINCAVKLVIEWLKHKELLSEHVYERKLEELRNECLPHVAKMYQEYYVDLDDEDDVSARLDLLRIGYFNGKPKTEGDEYEMTD